MPSIYHHFYSNQSDPHHQLTKLVKNYSQTIYLRPIPAKQQEIFDQLLKLLSHKKQKIIIDSCCGTGLSTIKLAQQFPHHFIVGIDKSAHRLSRSPLINLENYCLIRADVIDMWRLLARANLSISHHFLLFPNPWPKSSHLKRRFHAHPVFATMLKIAPYFEMRSNWLIYAQECLLALKTLGHQSHLEKKQDPEYLSLFEKKYLKANCPIYIVRSTMS